MEITVKDIIMRTISDDKRKVLKFLLKRDLIDIKNIDMYISYAIFSRNKRILKLLDSYIKPYFDIESTIPHFKSIGLKPMYVMMYDLGQQSIFLDAIDDIVYTVIKENKKKVLSFLIDNNFISLNRIGSYVAYAKDVGNEKMASILYSYFIELKQVKNLPSIGKFDASYLGKKSKQSNYNFNDVIKGLANVKTENEFNINTSELSKFISMIREEMEKRNKGK